MSIAPPPASPPNVPCLDTQRVELRELDEGCAARLAGAIGASAIQRPAIVLLSSTLSFGLYGVTGFVYDLVHGCRLYGQHAAADEVGKFRGICAVRVQLARGQTGCANRARRETPLPVAVPPTDKAAFILPVRGSCQHLARRPLQSRALGYQGAYNVRVTAVPDGSPRSDEVAFVPVAPPPVRPPEGIRRICQKRGPLGTLNVSTTEKPWCL
jgi:hypothetical protein